MSTKGQLSKPAAKQIKVSLPLLIHAAMAAQEAHRDEARGAPEEEKKQEPPKFTDARVVSRQECGHTA